LIGRPFTEPGAASQGAPGKKKHRRGAGRGRRRDVNAEARALVSRAHEKAMHRQGAWADGGRGNETARLTRELADDFTTLRSARSGGEDVTPFWGHSASYVNVPVRKHPWRTKELES
jgi:hypothetical protein